MSPKEKAEKLMDKFYQTTPNEAWYNPPLGSSSIEYTAWSQAKKCAWISVCEIMDELDGAGQKMRYNYYREVKQELESNESNRK